MNTILERIERIRFLILASMLLLVPVLIDLQSTLSAGPDPKFRLLEYGVLLACLLTLPLWSMGRIHLSWNLMTSTIGIWFFYIVGRAIVDPHWQFALDTGFHYGAWLIFILLVADACPTHREFFRMIRIAAVGQLAPVILAVGNICGVDIYLNWIIGQAWRWENPLIGADRSVVWSSLGNPNFYANYGALLFLWLSTLMVHTRRWWERSMWMIYIIVLLVTLLYTFTRGIWVSLFPTIGILVLLWIYRQIITRYHFMELVKSYWKPAVISTGSLLIVLCTVFQFEAEQGPLHNIARRFQHGLQLRDTSMRSRPLLWFAAIRMWSEKPIWGQGIGQYSPLFLETVYQAAQETDPQRIQHVTREMNTIRTDQAHNEYVQILAETGLVGYALFLLFLFSALFGAIGYFLSPTLNRSCLILATGCMAGIWLTVIQCIYDFPLLLPSSAILFSLAVSGILVLTRKEKPTKIVHNLWMRWMVVLLFAPFLAFGCVMVLKHLVAMHNLDKGSRFIDQGILKIQQSKPEMAYTHFHLAEPLLQRANRLFPHQGMVLFEIGRLFASQCQIQRDTRLRQQAIDHIVRAKETYCVPESYFLLAKLYLDDSRYAQAQKMSDILLLINPDHEDAHFLAAQIDAAGRKYAEALQHLQQELRRFPNNTRALSLQGAIEQDHFGHYSDAASIYQKLLAIEPMSVDTHIRLADVFVKLMDFTRAQQHYETALHGTRVLKLRDMEKSVELKLNDLNRKRIQQEGKTHDDGK